MANRVRYRVEYRDTEDQRRAHPENDRWLDTGELFDDLEEARKRRDRFIGAVAGQYGSMTRAEAMENSRIIEITTTVTRRVVDWR